MRILIDKRLTPEVSARLEFLSFVFEHRVTFAPVSDHGTFWCSTSNESRFNNLLFIVGHSYAVKEYVERNISTISEQLIVLNTCDICNMQSLKTLSQHHTFYICKMDYTDASGSYAACYDAEPYGFSFGATQSELLLMDMRKQPFPKSIINSFDRL